MTFYTPCILTETQIASFVFICVHEEFQFPSLRCPSWLRQQYAEFLEAIIL